jgi:tetratricopeptide (TPR) repeat protein
VRGLLKRRAEACDAFREAMDRGPTNANLCLALGRHLADCGEPRLARDAFQRALRAEPGLVAARQALAALPD